MVPIKSGWRSLQRLSVILSLAWALPAAADATAPETLRQAVEIARSAQQHSQQSQQQVDTLDDETRRMLEEYRAILRQTDNLRLYNEQMQGLVDSQQAEIASLNEQIASLEQTQQAILPLMKRMVDTLAQFVALDLPFLPDERAARVQGLQKLLTRADVTVSEKYRRILEAYQIENDYGRTIEAYRGRLHDAPDAPLVEFLRLGRVALYYLTLDGRQAGVWDAEAGRWVPLDDRYRRGVRQGMRIARQQATPELLELPVPVAEADDA